MSLIRCVVRNIFCLYEPVLRAVAAHYDTIQYDTDTFTCSPRMSERPVTSAQVRRQHRAVSRPSNRPAVSHRDVARRRQRRPRSSAATTWSTDRVHAPLTTTCPSTVAAFSSCQPPTSVCRRLPSLNRPASNSSVLKLPLSSSSFFIDPAPRRCSRSSSSVRHYIRS